MRYLNKKSKNNRSIVGIMGVLLLILGVGSLIFQYSNPVEVYAQVDRRPILDYRTSNKAIKAIAKTQIQMVRIFSLRTRNRERRRCILAKSCRCPGERGQKQDDPPN